MLEHMAELTIDPASEGDIKFYSACYASVWVIPCVPGSWSEVQPLRGFSIPFTPRRVCAPPASPHLPWVSFKLQNNVGLESIVTPYHGLSATALCLSSHIAPLVQPQGFYCVFLCFQESSQSAKRALP